MDPATLSVSRIRRAGLRSGKPQLALKSDGTVNDSTNPPLLDAGPFTGTTVIATKSLPGSITGVAQVQVVPGGGAALFNGASLSGVVVRERVILIWVR